MRELMLSIQPRWVEKIVRGEKTVEVRKTKPKCEVPFKCYIYCTQGKFADLGNIGNEIYQKRMKVIGEFVCDTIIDIPYKDLAENFRRLTHDIITPSCLKVKELEEYLDTKDGYGWHITDLVVYDEPRDLSEFYVWKKCNSCRDTGYESTACCYDEDCRVPAVVTRPPMSWQFCVATEPRQTAD